MTDIKKESKIAIAMWPVALATIVVFALCAFVRGLQGWFNVGAAFLGIEAICCIALDYFRPPKKGEIIKAPNRLSCISAGCIGLASGIFWILGSWPSLL